MKCRRCHDELDFRMKGIYEGDEDETGNPSIIIDWLCYDCDLEYNAVYHMTQLLCGTIDEGGGEIPVDLWEGRDMFPS